MPDVSDDPPYHWFERAIGDARLWGVLALVGLAIAFSRRSANSDLAVWLLLVIAGILIVLIVNTHRRIRVGQYRRLLTSIAVIAMILSVLFSGRWLTAPSSNRSLSDSDVSLAVEKGIAKSQRVELKPEIHGVYCSSGGSREDNEKPANENSPLYILVGVSLVNSGNVPTSAHGWRGQVEIQDKGAFEGLLVSFAKNMKTLSLKTPKGETITYSFDDFFTSEPSKLIAPGDTLPGLLMFRFEQLVERDVVPPTSPTRFCLRVSDSQHGKYDRCFDMTEATKDLRYFMVPGLRPEFLR